MIVNSGISNNTSTSISSENTGSSKMHKLWTAIRGVFKRSSVDHSSVLQARSIRKAHRDRATARKQLGNDCTKLFTDLVERRWSNNIVQESSPQLITRYSDQWNGFKDFGKLHAFNVALNNAHNECSKIVTRRDPLLQVERVFKELQSAVAQLPFAFERKHWESSIKDLKEYVKTLTKSNKKELSDTQKTDLQKRINETIDAMRSRHLPLFDRLQKIARAGDSSDLVATSTRLAYFLSRQIRNDKLTEEEVSFIFDRALSPHTQPVKTVENYEPQAPSQAEIDRISADRKEREESNDQERIDRCFNETFNNDKVVKTPEEQDWNDRFTIVDPLAIYALQQKLRPWWTQYLEKQFAAIRTLASGLRTEELKKFGVHHLLLHLFDEATYKVFDDYLNGQGDKHLLLSPGFNRKLDDLQTRKKQLEVDISNLDLDIAAQYGNPDLAVSIDQTTSNLIASLADDKFIDKQAVLQIVRSFEEAEVQYGHLLQALTDLGHQLIADRLQARRELQKVHVNRTSLLSDWKRETISGFCEVENRILAEFLKMTKLEFPLLQHLLIMSERITRENGLREDILLTSQKEENLTLKEREQICKDRESFIIAANNYCEEMERDEFAYRALNKNRVDAFLEKLQTHSKWCMAQCLAFKLERAEELDKQTHDYESTNTELNVVKEEIASSVETIRIFDEKDALQKTIVHSSVARREMLSGQVHTFKMRMHEMDKAIETIVDMRRLIHVASKSSESIEGVRKKRHKRKSSTPQTQEDQISRLQRSLNKKMLFAKETGIISRFSQPL